ncbi:hypothetical protein AAFN69_30480 [Streptomyces sp. CAU 1734]
MNRPYTGLLLLLLLTLMAQWLRRPVAPGADCVLMDRLAICDERRFTDLCRLFAARAELS